MKLEPTIFDQVDEEAEAAADARAEEDVKAGRVVSHDAVTRWLKSWGSADPLPRPKCGE
jgi:predicted transcriptional regulator